MLEIWGMWSTPSLPLLLGPLLPRVVAPDRVLSMGQIELKCALILNWIVWNRTVLTFNCMSTKSVLILNWIVWNRTDYTNSPGDWGSIPGRVIPKTEKMVLDAALLNTQHYKVRIKGKVEQSREKSSAFPLHLGVVAIEKGAFRSPSTKVTDFN